MVPVGLLVAALLVGGTLAALVVLAGRVGAGRKVSGTVKALHWFNDVRSLEVEVELRGWPGHKPGQYAFVTVDARSEEHTSELQSLMRISYAVFCLKKKNQSTAYYDKNTVTSQITDHK